MPYKIWNFGSRQGTLSGSLKKVLWGTSGGYTWTEVNTNSENVNHVNLASGNVKERVDLFWSYGTNGDTYVRPYSESCKFYISY